MRTRFLGPKRKFLEAAGGLRIMASDGQIRGSRSEPRVRRQARNSRNFSLLPRFRTTGVSLQGVDDVLDWLIIRRSGAEPVQRKNLGRYWRPLGRKWQCLLEFDGLRRSRGCGPIFHGPSKIVLDGARAHRHYRGLFLAGATARDRSTYSSPISYSLNADFHASCAAVRLWFQHREE